MTPRCHQTGVAARVCVPTPDTPTTKAAHIEPAIALQPSSAAGYASSTLRQTNIFSRIMKRIQYGLRQRHNWL